VAGFVGDPPMSLVRATLTDDQGRPTLRLSEGLLPLPDALAAQARSAPSRDVMVGLRPRHVSLAPAGEGALSTSVYAHEMIGRELQIMLTFGDDLVRCRTREPLRVAIGDKLQVKLLLDGARLFDAKSGNAL
jgi:ABC-type sugar transport system ATPase subunit